MGGQQLLFLTDHRHHTKYNSLYPLVNAMRYFGHFVKIDIASIGNSNNQSFFEGEDQSSLFGRENIKSLHFTRSGSFFTTKQIQLTFGDYDVIMLRLPPPIPDNFLSFLEKVGKHQIIINHPRGIIETARKDFLIHFKDLCPPLKVCHAINDILSFKKKFPIVLKPLNSYGGAGLIKIDGQSVLKGNDPMEWADFKKQYLENPVPYLAVKYLKKINQGDKRIIVVNSDILGASIRYPAKGSWLCNLAQGGEAIETNVDPHERYIITRIDPILSKKGILIYGVDTLTDDNGKRVLSEINTSSIGGLYMRHYITGEPIVNEVAKVIINYTNHKSHGTPL
jgi:glutathione synthase